MQHVSRTPPSVQNQTIDQKLLFQMQLFHKILRIWQKRLFQISTKLKEKTYAYRLPGQFSRQRFFIWPLKVSFWLQMTPNDLQFWWNFPEVNASSAIAVIWQHFAGQESHFPFHWKKSKILAIEVILNRWYFMSHKLWIIGPNMTWGF